MNPPDAPRRPSWRLVSGIDCSLVGGTKPEPLTGEALIMFRAAKKRERKNWARREQYFRTELGQYLAWEAILSRPFRKEASEDLLADLIRREENAFLYGTAGPPA